MPRQRDPNRDRAFEIWKEHQGQIDLVEIAEILNLSAGTIRGWKSKDKWPERLNGAFQNVRSVPKRSERSKPAKKITERIKPEEPTADELTEKQRLFVVEYLRDFNITRAAMAAGYSKKSAHVVGWETLRIPKVQAEVNRQKEIMTAELGLDVKRVIAELMKIAFTDISDVLEFGQKDVPIFDDSGAVMINQKTGEPFTVKHSYVSLKNADDIDSSVINEVKKTKEGVSIKLHDKMRALEKLERYIPFMTEEEKLKLDKLRADIKAAEMKVF